MKKYGEIYLEEKESPKQFGLGYNMLKSFISNEHYSQTYEHVEKKKAKTKAKTYRVLGANLTSFYMKSRASHVMVHYTGLRNYYVTVLEKNYINEIPFDKKYNIYYTDKEKLVPNLFYYNREFFEKIPYFKGEEFLLNKVLFLRQGRRKSEFHLFHPSLFVPELNQRYLHNFYVFLALKLLYKEKTLLLQQYKKKPYNIHDKVVFSNLAKTEALLNTKKINLVKYKNPYLVLMTEVQAPYSRTIAQIFGYAKAYLDYRDFWRSVEAGIPYSNYRKVYRHAYTAAFFHFYKLINLNLRNFNLNLMRLYMALKDYKTVYIHIPMRLTFMIDNDKYKKTLKRYIKNLLSLNNLYLTFKFYRKSFRKLPGYFFFFSKIYKKFKILLYNYKTYHKNLFRNFFKMTKRNLELIPGRALANFYTSFLKRIYFNYAIFRKPYLFQMRTNVIGTNLIDPNNLYINNANIREAFYLKKKLTEPKVMLRHDFSYCK